MTETLNPAEFLALCKRTDIHITNVVTDRNATYHVTYATTEPDSAEPAALPTEPNRQDDSGSGIEAAEQRHINPQEQLRSTPDMERKGQAEAQKDGGVEKAGENAPGDAKLLACPTCGTLNHENEPCGICAGLQRARSLASAKRREYALLKSAQRAQGGARDADAGGKESAAKHTWHAQSDP